MDSAKNSIQKLYNIISSSSYKTFNLEKINIIYILTSKFTIYVALLLKDYLESKNINVIIIYKKPKFGFKRHPHIVICAQIFPELPDFYIAYQMEQGFSNRWFTPEYINKLKAAYQIFDYSLVNISFLKSIGLESEKLNFIPIDKLLSFHKNHQIIKKYDILFYGDTSNERRQAFLKKINNHFKVKACCDLFESAMWNTIQQSKLVLNIHYYENALLETTRLFESLSLDSLIISEKSIDQSYYLDLENIIDFTEIGNIDQMISKIYFYLSDEKNLKNSLMEKQNLLIKRENLFQKNLEFFFMRECRIK